MAKPVKVTLANLGGGELEAHVNRAIIKLCENIADPAVKTDAKRSIDIKLEITPDKKGQTAEIRYGVKMKLPGPEASTTVAHIAMAPGTTEIALFGVDVRQADLFAQEQEQLTTEIKPVGAVPKMAEMPAAAIAPPMTNN